MQHLGKRIGALPGGSPGNYVDKRSILTIRKLGGHAFSVDNHPHWLEGDVGIESLVYHPADIDWGSLLAVF